MDDLVQWLTAQLDADERIARAACWCDDAATWCAAESEYGTPSRPGGPRWYIEDSMEDGVITTVDPQASADEGVARHIAAHDPARVLREIEAKRKLLRRALTGIGCGQDHPGMDVHHDGGHRDEGTLRLLASVYDDRPGYQEAWRP